jgi:drug/metabolite transporter (DMT)-like permease
MHRSAYVLLFLTALFWGGNAVAGKLAVGHVSPMLLTTLRWTLALMLLVAIGWPQIRRDWSQMKRHWVLLLTLGATGFGLFNVALYQALVFTSAINVMIEQAGMPLFIFVANFLLFAMRVTIAQVAGFVLSIVGVVVTATHGEPGRLFQLDVNTGDALMLAAIAFYGGYTVALRFKPEISWQSLMASMSLGAVLVSLPFTAWEFATDRAIMPDTTGWAVIAYTVLFPSMLSQVFFMKGVDMIGGNRAGLFINLVPVVGAALSVAILGETFHTYHAVAMALVLGGIWLAEHSGRRQAA